MANKGTVGPMVNDWITEIKPKLVGFKNSELYVQFQHWCEMKQFKIPTYASFNTAMKVHKDYLSQNGYSEKGGIGIVEAEDPKISLLKKERNIEVNVDLLMNGFSNGFILSGPTGIGKTSAVRSRLDNCDRDYIYFDGVIANPLEFYKYLYHHRDGKILVIDDTDGLIGSNAICGNIVSAALDDNHLKENEVSYLHKDLKHPKQIQVLDDKINEAILDEEEAKKELKAAKKLKDDTLIKEAAIKLEKAGIAKSKAVTKRNEAIPNRFTVTTGMIFLTNTPMAHVSKAIGSRCFPLDYWLTKDEIILKIENNLEGIFPDANSKHKKEVLNFFKKNKNEMKRFDIRSFKKACLYRFAQHQLQGSTDWKTMTKTLVNSGT